MSADSSIPDPYGLQSFNRYSYVYNNPLTLSDPSGFEPFGHDSDGNATQYNDTGNGTVSNTYTGDTYAADKDRYTPSRSTYGQGVSPQDIAGKPGGGAERVGEYKISTKSWEITDFGIELGSNNLKYAKVVEAALDSRSYRQMGEKRDARKPSWIDVALVFLGLRAPFAAAEAAAAREAKLLAEARATAAKNTGDLTKAEIKQIQKTVDEAGRPLDVVGSAAAGTRRGVGTNDPIGKGPGTKSDIDYVAPPSSLGYYDGLQGKLPGIDPKTGIIPGVANPNIGPSIRFEPR
jgi:hypothetical protein